MSKITINEIFYSIQGEGKWMGQPNIFIRTTGCNLNCSYCDTKYARSEGTEQSIRTIINKIELFSCKKICITGGEPLIQHNIKELCSLLIEKDYNLCVETNGSCSIDPLIHLQNLFFSLDIKCPFSKMHETIELSNIKKLRPFDQIKCIIKNKNDYLYAKNIITEFKPLCNIYFQPVWGISLKKLAQWILDDNLPIILGIQLHKYIWENEKGR